MEFRIYRPDQVRGCSPLELTPSERVELIKQLCPEIDHIVSMWAVKAYANTINEDFLDYLKEQMEE